MKVSSFFKLVEIRTKVASVIPFILGLLFTLYRYQTFKPILVFIFFVSMISIDLATTAINNFMDFKRAIKKHGYNYEEHNAMVRDGISEKAALTAIFILLTVGSVFGVILFINTDLIVLIIGLISFFIGILYSSGPLPIYRTPLGEIFSGVIMGGFIFFITTYIQVYELGIILISFTDAILSFSFNVKELIIIVLVSLPLIFMISNIMLANNICDIEDDKINLRHTLPIYIGRDLAVKVYTSLYILTYIFIVLGVLLSFLPTVNLLVLLTLIPVVKNIKIFIGNQDKATTFVLAVKNFIIISCGWIITFLIFSILNTNLYKL